jgi:hypothetical protein
VLNKATVSTNPNYTFNLLTRTTPLQARGFELLAVKPGPEAALSSILRFA